jgi:thioredoxin-related protein
MRLFAICLFLLVASPEWHTNFDSAKEIATRDHKLILLNFSGSDWCGPCIKMKKEVFENPDFITLADKELVLLRADFPRAKKNALPVELVKHNEALAERYNPEGKFPFTVLLGADGKVIKTWDGYAFASQDKVIADFSKTVAGKK